MPQQPHPDDPTVTIRPRWTWAGVGLLALGLALIGAAVIALMASLAIAGVVLIALGTGAAWRGNLYKDARVHHSPSDVISDVRKDKSVEVVDPDARVADAEAREVAREAHDTKVRALHPERTSVPIAPLGIALLLAVAAWLALSQTLVPFTETGRGTRNADIAVAIPLALAAFGLRTSVGRVFFYVLVLACGAALLILAAVLEHDAQWTMWSQVVSGILVFVGAALAIGRNGIATLGR